MRIIGLGFQNGEQDDSIVNDSLFMAQVRFTTDAQVATMHVVPTAVHSN